MFLWLCTSGLRFGYPVGEAEVSQHLLIAALSNCLISHSSYASVVGVVYELQIFVNPNSAYVNVELYSVLKASFFALLPFLQQYFGFN